LMPSPSASARASPSSWGTSCGLSSANSPAKSSMLDMMMRIRMESTRTVCVLRFSRRKHFLYKSGGESLPPVLGDFPIHIGPSGRKAAGRSHTAQSRVSHTQHDTANTSRCQRPRWQSRLRLLCLPPPRKVPAAARSSLTPETRGAVPRAGLRHSVLASCLLLLLAVDAGQRDAYERSLRATDHRGGKSLRKEMPQKIARPRPAAGDEEENLSARRRRRKFLPMCSAKRPRP
jgi:hypothetical protein